MPDYSQGKIYQVVTPQSTDIYIGCTTLSLSKRMAKHTDIKEQYGDVYVRLIEEYPCKSKEELELRRLHHINNKQEIIEANKSIVYENKTTLPRKVLIYQDDKQFIILQENNTTEVILKSDPASTPPEDVMIMSPRNLNSAITGYIYDINRKKKAYQQKKEKLKVQQEV
jgi:hypothetical protein